MRPVWARTWTEFRTHWRAWLALALIVGAGSGVSMALLAAGRRADRAYGNFSHKTNAADIIVAGAQSFGFVGNVDLNLVEQLPDIAQHTRAFASLLFVGKTNRGATIGPSDVFPVASIDTALGTTIERWKLLEGRAARPDHPEEATASFELARRLHLHVGDTIDFHFFRSKTFPQVAARLLTEFPQRIATGGGEFQFARLADGPRITIKVVGIEASAAEFPPLLLDISPILHLTPAFYDKYTSDLVGSPVTYVVLKDHRAIEPFKSEVERLGHGKPVSFISTRTIQAGKVQRSIRVEATALGIVGGLIALTFVVVVAQSLTRQALLEAGDHATLRALGMSPKQLFGVTLLRGSVIGIVGAVIGCVIAYALSSVTLLGLSNKADLGSGMYADHLVLTVGVGLFLFTVVATSIVAGRLASRRAIPSSTYGARPEKAGPVTALLRRLALPPAPAVGVRFALRRERAGPGVPIWTTVVGATVTIGLLVATWSFTASLRNVIDTPHLYGWNWDLRVGAPALPDIGGVLVPALEADKSISGLSAGTVTQARVRGQRIDLLGLQKLKGVVAPTFVAGRPPERNDEIALGARTMRALHLKLGDTVEAGIGDVHANYTIVGRAVFPEFGDAGQLGTGGYVTLGALDRLLPGVPRNIFFMKFRSGVDVARERQRISDAMEPLPHRVEGDPADLANLERVSSLPALFSVILVILVVVLLMHTLLTSLRRRRREFAVLEAMGFVRWQLRESIVVHALTLVGIALVIGIPLGLLAGRNVWKFFARGLGLSAVPIMPLGLVFAAVVAALALAAVVAMPPAWWATRRRPSAPLRSAE